MFNPSLAFFRFSNFRTGKRLFSHYFYANRFILKRNFSQKNALVNSLTLSYFFRVDRFINKRFYNIRCKNYLLLSGMLGIFHDKKEEEESELIITIKRAVLLIQVILT